MYSYRTVRIDGRPVCFRWTDERWPTWDEAKATGPHDVSPRANQYHPGSPLAPGEKRYDPACPYCWLNHSHTSDLHRQRTGEGG